MMQPYSDGSDKISPRRSRRDDADLIKTALARYEAGYNRDRDNILEAYEDLRFLAAIGDDQWDAKTAQQRRADGRPVLTINRLPTFHAQVTNDIRMGKPSIVVVPVDDKADPRTAEIRAGMIRYIENRSDAKAAYAAGCDSQVAAGIGHWKIVREYAGATTFNQELRIMPIEDGIGVIWDPDSVMPTREDAGWCFEPVDMSTDAFKAKFPDASAEDFSSLPYKVPVGWFSDEHVRVARYWVKKPVKRTLALLPGGSVEDLTEPVGAEDAEEFAARVAAISADVKAAQAAGHKSCRIEERDSFRLCSYLMTCAEVLEETEWPGLYIPIVPVLGKEIKFGRRTVRYGLVRHARDPQRLYNYMRSAQADATALQPRAPWLATPKNVLGFEAMWQSANSKSHPVLLYTPDPANGNAPPQRVAPPVVSSAWAEEVAQAAEELKSVTGIYDASLGARSNETSGRAILARERQGDTGTFNYPDSFALAVAHTGRILNDLIPHIYDSERTVRIVGEDGRMETMRINQPPLTDGLAPLPPSASFHAHDVTVGAYDIVMKAGPGYSTRREEAREMMQAFIQAVPNAAPLVLDLFAEMQDWPMAEKIKERLEMMLPPELQERARQERGEPPAPPQPPTPEQQAAMATKQLELEGGRLELESKALALEGAKVALADKIAAVAPTLDPASVIQSLGSLDTLIKMIGAMLTQTTLGAAPPMQSAPQPLARGTRSLA
jgi:hypothetical protein